MVELVYNPDARSTALAAWDGQGWTLQQSITAAGERLVPFSPHNSLITNELVLLASQPEEYGTEPALLSDIQGFIHRYVDSRPVFEKMASHYVLLTWLYDAFNELPYLRLRGDWGTGKTRALMTIGSLCYKAFFASGASTVSPIFRILDTFGGTLILDEADFRFSDEKAEVVKILNNGNVRGMPVLRSSKNREQEFDPRAFRVFGPKIIASRGTYYDQGLESRFITEELGGRTLRSDVPINLPPEFKEEARSLRNKLLLYRFRRHPEVRVNTALVDHSLEPRLNQMLLPLLSVVNDGELRSALRSAVLDSHANLAAERGFSVEGQVLEALVALIPLTDGLGVSVGTIAAKLKELHTEYDRPVTERWVGSILRKRLNLRTYKSNGVYIVPFAQRPRVEYLCRRYGIEASFGKGASGTIAAAGSFEGGRDLGDVAR